VTGILREELFVEGDEGGLSLSLIAAFAETEEVRNRNGRTQKGLREGLRGEESGDVAQPLEEDEGRVRLGKGDERRVSEPVRGLLLGSPGGNGP